MPVSHHFDPRRSMSPLSLESSVSAVESLSDGERHAMHALMRSHYEDVPWERFADDLSRKDEVVLLTDGSGAIRGFTTVVWNPAGMLPEGDVLFSGDTIIDRECWGSQELVRAFCRRAGEWRAASGRRLFWFLISKGHRTYLYLPLFARRFHPHPDQTEPEWQSLTSRLAGAMFGDAWKADKGVIRFPESRGHLRAELIADKEGNPWADFFVRRNPGFAEGEELACLTEMCESNLRRTALRAFIEGRNGIS